MHWIILLVSAVLEAVWATALSMSDGFSRPLPTVVFFVALTLSMVGLGYRCANPAGDRLRGLDRHGSGAHRGYSMLSGGEPANLLKVLFVAGIIGCVVGLKLVDGGAGEKA